MAGRTRKDEVSGEDLEAILELLDSDFLEDEMRNSFDEAVDEIKNGNFQCAVCSKVYKTKNGLKRHVSSKHSGREEGEKQNLNFSNSTVASLIGQCSKDLSEDLCFPSDICSCFRSFRFTLEDLSCEQELILKEIALLYNILNGKGDVENFFSKFYASITPKAKILFPLLNKNPAILLSTKLADKIVVHSKKPQKDGDSSLKKTSFSENEITALQYLGGYVLFNLNKKIFKSMQHKTESGQQQIAILQAGRSFDASNQHRLVDNVTRGGLWKISSIAEKIFMSAELYFHADTANVTKIIKPEIIVSKILVDQQVIGLFQTWTESCSLPIDNEVGQASLNNILMLYVKVRSFSYAKDVINKFKSTQRKGKTRSLRTEIKRKSDNQVLQQ